MAKTVKGCEVKMGRKRPVARCPRLLLKDYLRQALPVPPSSCDYTGLAKSVLVDIMGNDQLGDCVIAGGYHVVGVETGNAGDLFHASSAQVIKDYGAIGGYVPGNPATDQGCDEQTALNYWTQHGFANGTKLLGWLAIDATNKSEVMSAMDLFENVFFGIELPDAWITPFPSGDGFVWDKAGAANPQNGHAFVGVGYNSLGVQIDTWGMIGTITWAAVAAYASKAGQGELYVMLTPDQLTKGQTKAPNGVDWTYLIADFDSMGGNVPVPVPPVPNPTPPPPVPVPPAPTPVPTPPAPTPVPTPPAPVPTPPAPTVGVTLAQAQAWALSGLIPLHSVISKTQAENAVIKALAKHWPK
jgi:hypothetical protein